MSSITRVLHTSTWDFFTFRLPIRFSRSPKVVKEAIMTGINDLVQEVWRTSESNDGADGASFFAMRRLHEILEVCFDIISIFATAVDLADKILQIMPNSSDKFDQLDLLRAKFRILLDGKMFYQSFSRSKDLHDMLKLLPGVVVQKYMSIQGMAVLYRIKPDLLKRLTKSSIEPLKLSYNSRYILDDYLSGFLQDRDRSQLYYCDAMLQHIFICRHFLSLLNGSNTIDLQS